VIALAAPISSILAQGTTVATKCNGTGKTCGGVALFGVILMFGILAGGVFLLLQSNFGVLQGYLIAATAFWASWLVLSIIWFSGVPGIPLNRLQVFKKGIPTSTPRFYGPQGRQPIWLPLTAAESATVTNSPDFIPAAGTQRPSDKDAIKSAETAAADEIAQRYATELGTDKAKVTVPGTVLIDQTATSIIRSGGGASSIRYIKFTTKAATPGATATPDETALIKQVKPESFVFKLDKGTLAWPTYVALPLMFLLFTSHLFGLMWVEKRNRRVAVTARQRDRETASV
jgi:hypothetical protein